MSVKFMVLAAPRSGTTWAANWLTTDGSICLHDPLYTRYYTELDAQQTDKRLGVSCTGLPYFGDWVNAHPARKVILHREISEIDASLAAIGLPALDDEWPERLEAIRGMHVPWTDLFERPAPIYEWLLNRPFDAERHGLLKQIEMQPHFDGLTVGRDVTRRLVNEIIAARC